MATISHLGNNHSLVSAQTALTCVLMLNRAAATTRFYSKWIVGISLATTFGSAIYRKAAIANHAFDSHSPRDAKKCTSDSTCNMNLKISRTIFTISKSLFALAACLYVASVLGQVANHRIIIPLLENYTKKS